MWRCESKWLCENNVWKCDATKPATWLSENVTLPSEKLRQRYIVFKMMGNMDLSLWRHCLVSACSFTSSRWLQKPMNTFCILIPNCVFFSVYCVLCFLLKCYLSCCISFLAYMPHKYTTGQKYGIFLSPMETLVLDILICWKWLGTNYNQVLSL